MGKPEDLNPTGRRSRSRPPPPPGSPKALTVPSPGPSRLPTPSPPPPQKGKRVITYRLDGRDAFSGVASSYSSAIKRAKQAFPEELKSIDPSRISLSIDARSSDASHSLHQVRIAPSAWKSVTGTFMQYQVVFINVVSPSTPPTIVVQGSDSEVEGPPPLYDLSGDEAESPIPSPTGRHSPGFLQKALDKLRP